MLDAVLSPPPPSNEPVLSYAPGTPERAAIKQALASMSANPVEIPLFIDGKEVTTGDLEDVRAPHRHDLLIGRVHRGNASHVNQAIDAARRAHPTWSSLPWADRAAVFLKAAELLAGPYRAVLNASTMLGQSKTAH